MKETLVIYSPGAFSRYGHAFDYTSGLGAAMDRIGVEVHVLGWEGPLSLPQGILEHRVSRPRVFKRDLRQHGIVGDLIWGIERVRCQGQLFDALVSLCDGIASPHLLFETFEYLALFRALKHFRSDECSCIFHDTSFDNRHQSVAAATYKRFVRYFARSILRSVRIVYVHGQEMKRNLASTLCVQEDHRLVDRIRVIPYGAPHPHQVEQVGRDEARERLKLPRDQNLLLAFGTLRKDKDYEFILMGLARATDWCLVVAGPEGDYTYEDLMRLSQRAGVENRVITFKSFIPADEHALYFGAADAVVNIYARNVRHESGTAQRARTFLRPIIVGGTPDLDDYVASRRIGWSVDVTNPESLVAVLDQMARLDIAGENSLRKRIHECAVVRSWDSVAKIVLQHSLC